MFGRHLLGIVVTFVLGWVTAYLASMGLQRVVLSYQQLGGLDGMESVRTWAILVVAIVALIVVGASARFSGAGALFGGGIVFGLGLALVVGTVYTSDWAFDVIDSLAFPIDSLHVQRHELYIPYLLLVIGALSLGSGFAGPWRRKNKT